MTQFAGCVYRPPHSDPSSRLRSRAVTVKVPVEASAALDTGP